MLCNHMSGGQSATRARLAAASWLWLLPVFVLLYEPLLLLEELVAGMVPHMVCCLHQGGCTRKEAKLHLVCSQSPMQGVSLPI